MKQTFALWPADKLITTLLAHSPCSSLLLKGLQGSNNMTVHRPIASTNRISIKSCVCLGVLIQDDYSQIWNLKNLVCDKLSSQPQISDSRHCWQTLAACHSYVPCQLVCMGDSESDSCDTQQCVCTCVCVSRTERERGRERERFSLSHTI